MATQTSEKPVYIYDADSHWRWRTRLHELVEHAYLLYNLIVRDIKARYKNSVLGILWSMLNPLGLMLVFTIVFSVLRSADIRQFPIFLLVALIPWRLFSESLSSGSNVIIANASLVKKVYFPRELLPISVILSSLVNYLFGLIVLVIFLYAFGMGLTVYALWMPLILLTQTIFTLGLVFILSSVSVFYRDVQMILEVIIQAWFFFTPIFYSFDTFFGPTATVWGMTFNPTRVMRWINPMASIIDGYRTVLWGTAGSLGPVSMDPINLLRTLIESLIVLAIGYAVFIRSEHLFGEKL
ncbi:MAG: ABC transporter permease [Anaerolineales bacterium]|nr:ABC transporter permease [Anaerolineales bacterium]MCB8991740.1 ABC transporter permease [Ardenticatenaceae bacterium]